MEENEEINRQLQQAISECARLREENTRLRMLLSIQSGETNSPDHDLHLSQSPSQQLLPSQSASTSELSPETKIKLFRGLFRGRDDVYALRWESRKGNSGYSPACIREWEQNNDGTFRLKKDAVDREYVPLTDEVIRNHLTGKCTVGIYPLLMNETCWLLATDFDKKTWEDDARAFLETCRTLGVPAALERSRSGNGGHVWIFFDQPLAASTARKLRCVILTRTMEQRHQIGLDSYDRFFPNQDTMPKGGFGNLIALPLQHEPRAKGNSVFINENLQPHPDQWQFLTTLRRITANEVDSIIQEALRHGDLINVRASLTDEQADEDPWTLPPSKKRMDKPITEPLPEKVRIVRGNLLYIEKAGLPSAMLNRLIRVAAFQNPEFYRAQAMRLSTFGKPRVIRCAEEFTHHIGLPRGCLDDVLTLLKSHDVKAELIDERFHGHQIEASFRGELRPLQQMAAAAMQPHDDGIICAPTAFGKTAIAAWLIAERKTNTLVLVHRQQLLDQWRERLASFMDLPIAEIGRIGAGKSVRTGFIDIGMIQSLNRKGEVKDAVADYGHIIIDECHHLSAFTFEQVMRQAKAKYVTGLTATPVRKDGHHPIIMMQCGPIRYHLSERKMAEIRPLQHTVVTRHTDFSLTNQSSDLSIQEIYRAIALDERRNGLIVNDILHEIEAGRSPLLLTERTDHLKLLTERLHGTVQHVIELKGGLGKKQRQQMADKLQAISDQEPRVILATGRYIGEGFDDARLDTLFLAMPISWRGTLQQYVGRLHRTHGDKRAVRVYDYVNYRVPMLTRMYEKRVRGYKAIGYTVEGQGERETLDEIQTGKTRIYNAETPQTLPDDH
ncbi:MAG TPA: DEAD/DEAH box helicase family protein [Blastocatellia bacterium]|nr:DEAD/DEAH box helicase family protein [Blastocatellia bacterium]